jgi:protein-L-isoaspartate(D-aspartate) O-methyltransferase
MTEALELTGKERVLEIGTGSGYQTAILAELAERVYTIERIRPLMEKAHRLLADLGYANVIMKAFDGTLGWREYEPFEAIIVTAGAPEIPTPLLEQLTEGGRMIVPIGDRFSQKLVRVKREADGYQEEDYGGCRFVDLIGVYGWKE